VHGKVHSATVQELDLVNDKTIVDVRYAYVPASARSVHSSGAHSADEHGEIPRRDLAPAPAGAA
jgi:hypothetical protein